MNFETRAARIVALDEQINLFRSRDPTFVASRLVPQRAQAWQKFCEQFSASCTSSNCWEFAQIITRSVTP